MVWVETRSWTGSGAGRRNEDYACASVEAGCAVLVDGATGLTGVNLVAGTSDAAWYARRLAEGTVARLGSDERGASQGIAQVLVAALGDAGRAVANEYLALPGARGLGRAEIPNGSVAAVAWDEASLALAMLGDCTAVVLGRDGRAEVVHDATLDALDAANYRRMYNYARDLGTTMAEARRALNDCFVANRSLLNQPGGYWAADTTCAGFGHEQVRTFARNEVAHVALLTDGFAAAAEMGVVAGIEQLGWALAVGEGERLGGELRAAERADAGCWEHPRSKTSDDATYVIVSL